MKKIAITALALAALSTTALANQRGYDLRDTEYWTSSGVSPRTEASVTMSHALASEAAETAFDRMTRQSATSDQGRHN
jgi:hypothetical protein